MANKKPKEAAETPKEKTSSSILTYEEYYNTLMLAKKIRLENAEELEKAQTPKEKTQLLERLFLQYNISGSTSSDAKEKEQATLLKVNIFMPDSEQFIEDYKTKFGKNVRLISDAYQVPAPFVFNKVMEIGKYEKYLVRLVQEGGLGEPELDPKSPIEVIGALASSGALKPLYDAPTPLQATNTQNASASKKGKTSKRKDNQPKAVAPPTVAAASSPTPEKRVPAQEQETIVDSALSGVVSKELLRHLESMQRYCTRLLDSNEQLARENTSLQGLNREFDALIKRLKQENDALRAQNYALSAQATSSATEHDELIKQISKLSAENAALKEQITATPEASITQPRSIADETATEKELRQQIKDLQFEKQELESKLKDSEKKKYHYRNRAVVAEAELEQLQTGMQGIFKEVDELDLSFMEGAHKKN